MEKDLHYGLGDISAAFSKELVGLEALYVRKADLEARHFDDPTIKWW